MEAKIIEIEVQDKNISTTIQVEQLSSHVFRIIENEPFFCNLALGTEFETQQNKDGKHEIIRIINTPEFITRRFSLTSQFKESEYRLLGDEIMKHGGFWQVDFGSIAIINLPKDCKLNIDEVFRVFDFKVNEIFD
jgi:hypothetical protein